MRPLKTRRVVHDTMTSRERLLAAIEHREPDRVPICFRDVAPLEHLWRDPFERALVLRDMGVDDKLFLHPPVTDAAEVEVDAVGSLYAVYGTGMWPIHPDVTVREWEDVSSDGRYTIVHKALDTPKGPLVMAARRTDDWRVTSLPLVSDHLWSRGVEFLIKGEDDLDRLRYILHDPLSGDLSEFRERVGAVKTFAAKHDILVEGDVNAASNIALSLRGPTNLMCDSVENPAFIEELLDIIMDWNMKRLELILDIGVDTVYHTACYETTAFWSPEMYRRFFRPLLERKLTLIHEAGARLHYYMDLGVMPLIDDFGEMGIDILSTLDPAPFGDTDIAEVKKRIGDRVCLWGGVDVPHVIERGTPEQVRQAVRDVIEIAADGGGFVLSTADSVWDAGAYDNVMAFIVAGLEYGRYPFSH